MLYRASPNQLTCVLLAILSEINSRRAALKIEVTGGNRPAATNQLWQYIWVKLNTVSWYLLQIVQATAW